MSKISSNVHKLSFQVLSSNHFPQQVILIVTIKCYLSMN